MADVATLHGEHDGHSDALRVKARGEDVSRNGLKLSFALLFVPRLRPAPDITIIVLHGEENAVALRIAEKLPRHYCGLALE